MNIGRRSFLSFLIGGAAGTALSPLPWKLTDDSSIWSQNWPWTPVPEDGEVSFVNSACSLCPGKCGITVRKVEDRAIKIEGMKGHPVNDGGLCIFGLSGLQLLYGPTRAKAPMKRVGDRGRGEFKAISWEEAISEAAERLGSLRAAGKPQSVAFISGSAEGTVPALIRRFMEVYGSPNFMTPASIDDSYRLTLEKMQGVSAAAGFDLENTDFVLSFGSGIIDGWGSPVRMFRANSRWKEGKGTVVQIEPRLSNTAAKSDRWVAINPGTEAALALGLAHVVILEKRYRSGFVNSRTNGFEPFSNLVMTKYSPEQVAGITGIARADIVTLARDFSRASRPLAICGAGSGKTPGSLNEFMAVHALNALMGNINAKGGVWAVPGPAYPEWPEAEKDETAAAGLGTERLDGAGSGFPAASRMHRFFDAVSTGKGYPVEALLIAGTNPCYSQAGAETVRAALEKIPFVVSFSSYMDETALNADLILPNHTYLERIEDVPAPSGFPRPIISLATPVVEPQFNTRHLGDVVMDLARTLGGTMSDAFAWETFETCLEESLADRWDALLENGFWTDAAFAPAAGADFGTASGKFEFFPAGLENGFAPVAIDGEEGAYPLVLIPYDSMRLASGYAGNTPFMTKTVDETVLEKKSVFVEINSKTAGALNLSEGRFAVLTTPKGKARVRIHIFDGVMPGVVALPRGLGHSGPDKYLAGKGVNFNDLIGPVEDPVSGLDAAWGIRAKLAKA